MDSPQHKTGHEGHTQDTPDTTKQTNKLSSMGNVFSFLFN